MCGIWLFLNTENKFGDLIKYSTNIKNRGPDNTSIYESDNIYAVFHRLAINGTSNGNQPFIHKNDTNVVMVICNGEIYNYKELYAMNPDFIPTTQSDCEIILHLYLKYKYNFVKYLNGEFAFIIYDYNFITTYWELIYARDRFGIRPLFVCQSLYPNKYNHYNLILSSLLKGCPPCEIDNKQLYRISQVEPRKLFVYTPNDLTEYVYYSFKFIKQMFYRDNNIIYELIRNQFIKSVHSRLMSERPFGCFLSGGLDSSLVAGITSLWCKQHNLILNTFSIGFDGSTDEIFAKQVAAYIDSNHTHVKITFEEALNAIPDVIYAIESYDITTVRASVGQYLLAKYIANNTNIKVLLIGDGSDELAGGYHYMKFVPRELFTDETINLLSNIHYYDVLRADRGISTHGLEARVPFLDHEFVDLYLSVDETLRYPTFIKDNIEKQLLRNAFLTFEPHIIPSNVLNRPKEAFSDGVSSVSNSWYKIIQNHVSTFYNEVDLLNNKYIFNPPKTLEALYYRDIFNKHFPHYEHLHKGGCSNILKEFWMPKFTSATDPSARVLPNYST